jgi:hypothetical protein
MELITTIYRELKKLNAPPKSMNLIKEVDN